MPEIEYDVDNDIRICVLGLGEHGTNAVAHVKKHSNLPLLYEPTSNVDCIIIISALESEDTAETIISAFSHHQQENQLVLTIALRPQIYDALFNYNLHKIKLYCCILISGEEYNSCEWHWPNQYQFALQVIEGLFSPLFQYQLLGVDYFEIQTLLKPDMIALAFYQTIKCDDINSSSLGIAKLFKRQGIKFDSKTEVFINVVQSRINLENFDLITSLLFDQLYNHEYLVCYTIDQNIDNEIGLFIVITDQDIKMNFRQRSIISDLHNQAAMLQGFSKRLCKKLIELDESVIFKPESVDFSEAEIESLVNLNERLIYIEKYLKLESEKQCPILKAQVADPESCIYDFELDVTVNYTLRSDDPEFDEDEDNVLTTRYFSIKRLDRGREEEYGIGDDQDHKEPCRRFPGILNEVRHCSMFHDLYDHSYGIDKMALSLSDCLRIGEIWIDIEIKKQASLNVDDGIWQYKKGKGN